MLLNCGAGEDSSEFLGQQGNQTSQSWRKSTPNIHWKNWCLGWSFNTLATWCEKPIHWKRPWYWKRLKAGGEGDDKGQDGWMASSTQWAWVWAYSGRQWSSPPGSSVHRILQARILGWVAIPFSRESSQPRDQTQVSHIAGHLSHQGSWRILECFVPIPTPGDLPDPGIEPGELSCIAGRFFTSWTAREALVLCLDNDKPNISFHEFRQVID